MAAAGIGDFYRKQKSVALRTTRDLLGKLFFDKIGVPAELRPCPSFFSTLHIQPAAKTRNAIAFLSDDTFVTNRVRGDMGEHLARLIARLPGYELCAHSKGDLVQLGRHGGEHLYFRTELDAIEYYATVGRLAALRVHAGVPAWTLGADVVVGEFDGRARMFSDVGMPLPVLNLIDNDFTALADMLDDPATHTPYSERKRLIEAAFTSFVARLREVLPELAGGDEPLAAVPAGFRTYPFEGRVERREGCAPFWPPRPERRPTFLNEDAAGERGVVVIPKGQIAKHGEFKPVELPLRLKGRDFKAASSAIATKVAGEAIVVSLEKKGALARAPQERVPFGRYRIRLLAEVHTDAPLRGPVEFALAAKTSHASYGEASHALRSLAAGDTNVPLVLEFENTFPSAAIILDVILRGQTAPTAKLRIQGVEIESAT